VPREARAFAPGRVNLIGEHTDYNRGLALPFAIAEGVTVRALAATGDRIRAQALDIDERDEFLLDELAPLEGSAPPASGSGGSWRAFVRGTAAELRGAGCAVLGADLEIAGDVPRGAGLSSSAALAVALAMALLALTGGILDRRELARLCSRVENEWVGAHTGLLDQLASLFGEPDHALLIDFADLSIEPVPLALAGGWRLLILDSGEPRALARSGYNARRRECTRACELLGIASLREAGAADLARLPDVLARRVEHVLAENARVRAMACALREHDLPGAGALLDASHVSLRDLYECSTPAVEATVRLMKQSGAAGARMLGGGFGGHVLGLFPPDARPPARAREVGPSHGAVCSLDARLSATRALGIRRK
jgi:galactokinase